MIYSANNKNIKEHNKETKYILENFISPIPYNKSERKNKTIPSQKKEKYTIHTKPSIRDIQKGIKSIDNSSIKEDEILSIITLFYTLKYKIQTYFKLNIYSN